VQRALRNVPFVAMNLFEPQRKLYDMKLYDMCLN